MQRAGLADYRDPVVWAEGAAPQLATAALRTMLAGMDLLQQTRDEAATSVSSCAFELASDPRCASAAFSLVQNRNNVSAWRVLPPEALRNITLLCMRCTVSVERSVSEWRHDAALSLGLDSWAFSCVDAPTAQATLRLVAASDAQLQAMAAANSAEISTVTAGATTAAAMLVLGRCKGSPATLYNLYRSARWFALCPVRIGDSDEFDKHDAVEPAAAVGMFVLLVGLVVAHVCCVAALALFTRRRQEIVFGVKPFKIWFAEAAVALRFPSLSLRVVAPLHPLLSLSSFYTVSHAKTLGPRHPVLFVVATIVAALCLLFPLFVFCFAQHTASTLFQSDEACKPITTTSSNGSSNRNINEQSKVAARSARRR